VGQVRVYRRRNSRLIHDSPDESDWHPVQGTALYKRRGGFKPPFLVLCRRLLNQLVLRQWTTSRTAQVVDEGEKVPGGDGKQMLGEAPGI
jgi:hypothetical protein